MATSDGFGVTDQGFVVKRTPHIINSIKARLAAIQDSQGRRFFINDPNDVSYDPDSDGVLTQVVDAISESIGKAWAEAFLTMGQFDVDKASGVGLTAISQLLGLQRKFGLVPSIEVAFVGPQGLTIPQGHLVTFAGRQFRTDNTVIIPTTNPASDVAIESGTVIATAVINQPLLNLTGAISTQTPSGDSANPQNNPITAVFKKIASDGTVSESDEELRLRRNRLVSTYGQGAADRIASAIININGVYNVRVWSNPKMTDVVNGISGTSTFPTHPLTGIPYKELCICVEYRKFAGGGEYDIEEEIGLQIQRTLPMGCEGTHPVPSVGIGITAENRFTYTYVDLTGLTRFCYWISVVRLPIKVEINLTVTGDLFQYDLDMALMIERLINYATHGDLTNWDGFAIGENVDIPRMYTPINETPDVRIDSIILDARQPVYAADGSVTSGNSIGRAVVDNSLPIFFYERSLFLAEDITINWVNPQQNTNGTYPG